MRRLTSVFILTVSDLFLNGLMVVMPDTRSGWSEFIRPWRPQRGDGAALQFRAQASPVGVDLVAADLVPELAGVGERLPLGLVRVPVRLQEAADVARRAVRLEAAGDVAVPETSTPQIMGRGTWGFESVWLRTYQMPVPCGPHCHL